MASLPLRKPEGIRFSAYLGALSQEINKARSGEKTKLRLLFAGAALLDCVGFRELNVEDVPRSVGMAKGTFYVHFLPRMSFCWNSVAATLSLN
jgi:hypothetical protein